MKRLVFVSAEPSGDDLAVDVITEIRRSNAEVEISAIGGKALNRIGLYSPLDVSPLSVVGLFEGLKIYKTVIALADSAAEFIISKNPEAVILVDSWGFTLRVAKRVRALNPNIRLIKLVGPQVWASRAGRAETLASTVDHLLCIHPFEVPYYQPYGLPCTVIGNPALDRLKKGDGSRFRKDYGIADEETLLLVLPGSRRAEIQRVAPTLALAARDISLKAEDKPKICVLVADAVKEALSGQKSGWPDGTLLIEDESRKADIMSAADLAIACSGTVTTELATQNCPMIVGYKMGWLTWFLARFFLFKSPYVSLINVAAGKEIVPEFIQTRFTVANLVKTALALLASPEQRNQMKHDMQAALKVMGMGGKTAPQIASEAILKDITEISK